MGFLEQCGLVKMDFLGLKTLDLIKNTVDIIRGKGGDFADFTIEAVPEDDKRTYDMLSGEENEGVFQFEKNWWKEILREAKPASIEELTALNSLGRPGPIQFIPQFIASKWGRQAIEYPDPSLEGVLKETYGVIVYQEQVMQVARTIAGYTIGQADLLRRAMGKKKKEIIDKEKIPFISGALKQGFSAETAGRIYDILVPFADYGFNKSHAAAYSVLSYRTAYLKANFPAEFMAANLTNEIGAADKDKLPEYIEVSRRMGISLDPPDVNRSDKLFTVVEGRIIYGLRAIKGIGDAPAGLITAGRKAGGPYRDFIDFLTRIDIKALGKKVVELLIQTGAFDSIMGAGKNRATLLHNMERAIEYIQTIKNEKAYGQTSLFEDSGDAEYAPFIFEEQSEFDRLEMLETEKSLIGFYFSGHPLDQYKDAWQGAVTLDLSQSSFKARGENEVILGTIQSLRVLTTKKGDPMGYATLRDYRGEMECTIFPKVWKEIRDKFPLNGIAALQGRLEKPDPSRGRERPNFLVDELLDLDELEERYRGIAQKTAEIRVMEEERQAEQERREKDLFPDLPPPAEDYAEEDPEMGASFFAEEPEMEDAELNSLSPAVFQPPASPAGDEAAEVHIRLNEGAAHREEGLYPLRDYLLDHPGSCRVYIHVPQGRGEAVILSASPFRSADADALDDYTAVAKVWVTR
jgi:DNA polymerase-3 subunit alpha